jgi:hypothetical protein
LRVYNNCAVLRAWTKAPRLRRGAEQGQPRLLQTATSVYSGLIVVGTIPSQSF